MSSACVCAGAKLCRSLFFFFVFLPQKKKKNQNNANSERQRKILCFENAAMYVLWNILHLLTLSLTKKQKQSLPLRRQKKSTIHRAIYAYMYHRDIVCLRCVARHASSYLVASKKKNIKKQNASSFFRVFLKIYPRRRPPSPRLNHKSFSFDVLLVCHRRT